MVHGNGKASIRQTETELLRRDVHEKNTIRLVFTSSLSHQFSGYRGLRMGAQENLRATCGHLRTPAACKLRT